MRHLRPEGHEECDVRIRELEAELAGVSPIALHPHASRWFLEKCHDLSYKERDLLKARAEKAEAALNIYQEAEPIWRARVAELSLNRRDGLRCEFCGRLPGEEHEDVRDASFFAEREEC